MEKAVEMTTAIAGMDMDSLERKQIEEALRISEEKYRTLFDMFNQGFCICEMLVDDNGMPYDYRFLEVNQLFEDQTGLKDAAGKTALELVPNLEPHWIETYGRVALTGEPLRFEQGSPAMGDRWFDVYAFRIGRPEDLQFAIVFNDISTRKRAEDRALLLRTLAATLSKSLTRQEITQVIMQKGVDSVGAVTGLVALLSDDKTTLNVIGSFTHLTDADEAAQSTPLSHPTALIARAVRDNMPIWISTPTEDSAPLSLTAALPHHSVYQAWAALPFNVDNDVIGVIGLGFAVPHDFDSIEQTFLFAMTELCAQALYRTKLMEQIGPMAASNERQRLSRDLHDAVKQHLFASSLIAESLPGMWARTPEKAQEYTASLLNLNRAALAELQSLLFEMRPSALVTTPFMTLVRNLCNGLRGHKTIAITIEYEGPDELYLPADTHIALYRLVQETLNNVNKHSEATTLTIDCAYSYGILRLTIKDNGIGFDPASTSPGLGMSTMRERAQAVDARLEVSSRIGEGTQVSLEWPMSRP